MACPLTGALTGCRDEQPPQATATTSPTTPEESFQEIVRLVKDGIEVQGGGPVSVVVPGDNASTRFQVQNTVTSQIFPPSDANAAYRGTITVTSTSTYSLRKSTEDNGDDKNADKSAKDNGFSLQGDSDEADPGFEAMDDQLVSDEPASDKTGATTIKKVQRRSDENVRTYDLVYDDGRWALTSKLDPETEKSIENAFKRALSLQP
jgi:hypothetical protein